VIPQGKLTGLCTNRAKTQRVRGVGSVSGQVSADGGATWAAAGSDVPDAHGRYELGPYKEQGLLYRLTTAPDETTGVTNREYSWVQAPIIYPPRKGLCGMNCDPGTGIPCYAWCDADGYIWWNKIVDGVDALGTPVLVDDTRQYSGASYDRFAGMLHITGIGAEDGVPYHFLSRDGGETWAYTVSG